MELIYRDGVYRRGSLMRINALHIPASLARMEMLKESRFYLKLFSVSRLCTFIGFYHLLFPQLQWCLGGGGGLKSIFNGEGDVDEEGRIWRNR